MINYEYELHTIRYEYTTNTYDSRVTRYDTITIYYDQNRIVIVLGQPYSGQGPGPKGPITFSEFLIDHMLSQLVQQMDHGSFESSTSQA